MHAIIRRIQAPVPALALVDLAGRPLVARQIQWLHANGCDRIALEVHPGERELRRWVIANARALGPELVVVPPAPAEPVGRVVARAGLSAAGPVVVVGSRVLGDFDLTRALGACGDGGALVHAEAPRVAGRTFASGAVRVWRPGAHVPNVVVPGWCAELARPDDVLDLAFAALEGALPARDDSGHLAPIQIHAFEQSPGVWLARGSWVSPRARIAGPVLLGENCVVDAGAVVGPRAVLGARSAVETGASVVGAAVPPRTIVSAGGRWERYGEHGSALRALLGA